MSHQFEQNNFHRFQEFDYFESKYSVPFEYGNRIKAWFSVNNQWQKQKKVFFLLCFWETEVLIFLNISDISFDPTYNKQFTWCVNVSIIVYFVLYFWINHKIYQCKIYSKKDSDSPPFRGVCVQTKYWTCKLPGKYFTR